MTTQEIFLRGTVDFLLCFIYIYIYRIMYTNTGKLLPKTAVLSFYVLYENCSFSWLRRNAF